MDTKSLVRTLHPLEIKILQAYDAGIELDAARLASDLGYKEGQANQAFSWLRSKGLAEEAGRASRTVYEITPLGLDWASKGTPEERILRHIAENGPARLPSICAALGLEQKDVGSAFGLLAKDGALFLDSDKQAVAVPEWLESTRIPGRKTRIAIVRDLLERAGASEGGILEETSLAPGEQAVAAGIARKRGAGDAAFRIADRETVRYRLTDAVSKVRKELAEAGIAGDEAGALTPAMLESGSWKRARFRAYNVRGPAARLIPGRRNSYTEFLEGVKDKLVSLGFQEFDGSLVETEFWNCDALFMPQFHAARDIHDVYRLVAPTRAREIEEPYLSNVAAAHENGGRTGSRGWGYCFDRDFTKRLILRSQGTVLSARTLHRAEVPGRYFGIARCFRYDRVDATHLSDFYQTEGIVLGEDVNLRTLLGFLEMFAVEVAGAREVKYVPGYFPFTEPSVEVHIRHPVLGWFELGGSGIFRPEVTEPLGVHVPVLAWGIGIDRMALMALGLNDLRELFSPDIESVRLRRAKI
ncbi:MAG TPA: phenylalanine--tRNA ligase subunit alpha [Magnetospirillaceae bacterium]|nr:phenylalanine--tRNA ligase subunit alpha [Magnetospirillaceae bacterium]